MKAKKSSKNILTARQKGADRTILLGAAFLLVIFMLCSIYAILVSPTNPASWSMATFFILGFVIIMAYEENVFPDLQKRKIPYAIALWFFSWMFVALLVSFLTSSNFTHLGIAVLFGMIIFVLSSYVATSETGWITFKGVVRNAPHKASNSVRKSFNRKQKKKKPKKKKKKVKKRRLAGW